MKYFLLLTALIFFGCAQDNSGPAPAPTLYGLPFGTTELHCDGTRNTADVFSLNFAKDSGFYSRSENIKIGCSLITYGTYTYDGVTLTTTETSQQLSPIGCDQHPRPLATFTGTTSLRAFRLVWNYVNQNNQSCTAYLDR